MDERANQMRDVREELVKWLQAERVLKSRSHELADAILARFDVTEKPVVTGAELGDMVQRAHWPGEHPARQGGRMRDQLEAKGLTIVRSGEAVR